LSGLADQPVPSPAAAVDDFLGRVEEAVGKAIVAQMQPQSLDWVELKQAGSPAPLYASAGTL